MGGRAVRSRRPPTRRAHLAPAPARQYEEMRAKETEAEREARESQEEALRQERVAALADTGHTSHLHGVLHGHGLHLRELHSKIHGSSISESKNEDVVEEEEETPSASRTSTVHNSKKRRFMHKLTKHRKDKKGSTSPESTSPRAHPLSPRALLSKIPGMGGSHKEGPSSSSSSSSPQSQ